MQLLLTLYYNIVKNIKLFIKLTEKNKLQKWQEKY